jgi:hypothetical protein
MTGKIYNLAEHKRLHGTGERTTSYYNFELGERNNASGESSGNFITSARRALLSELTSACERARNPSWDGNEATPVAYLTYYYSVRFIEQLPQDLPRPEISPDNDGYIEFEWYNHGKTFSFYVTPSDVVLYAAYFSRNDRFSGRFTLNDEIPAHLLQRIREVYSEKIAS